MGLFSKWHTRASRSWEPEGRVTTRFPHDLPGNAAGAGYGLTLTNGIPGPRVALWGYAATADPPHSQWYVARIWYRYTTTSLPLWSHADHTDHPDGAFYGTPEEAEAAARALIESMALDDRDWEPWFPGILGWDGQAW